MGSNPAIEINLLLCHPSPKARRLDQAAIKSLAASIEECGLLAPIIARKVQRLSGGRMTEAFEVIAGLHRVEAFRQIGRETIPAVMLDVGDLRAELMLIDENLFPYFLKRDLNNVVPILTHFAEHGEGVE